MVCGVDALYFLLLLLLVILGPLSYFVGADSREDGSGWQPRRRAR
jgi:hypothetical protein